MSAAKKLDVVGHSNQHDDDEDEHVPPRKKPEEGEGPWLVSYADLMTLLMGFFALIASMSSPTKQNIEKMRESATHAFGGKYEKPYKDLGVALLKVIKEKELQDQVQVNIDVQGITLTFRGTMFFESGEYIVKQNAAELMATMAEVIKSQKIIYKALIEGHTDSLPISSGVLASNWELSGIRAARIAQLFEKKGFTRDQLTLIGWGDARPLVPNTDAAGNYILENMQKNRRVVIRVYDERISDSPYREVKQERDTASVSHGGVGAGAAVVGAAGAAGTVTGAATGTNAAVDTVTGNGTATNAAVDTATGTGTATDTGTVVSPTPSATTK